MVSGHGARPKDLVEPMMTIGDDARRWEIYRHPARSRRGYVVLFSYHDRTRSKIVETGTLAQCRAAVHTDLLGDPPRSRWLRGTVQRAVWRRRARRLDGLEETPVAEMRRRVPDGWGIGLGTGRNVRVSVREHPEMCAAASSLHAAASDCVMQLAGAATRMAASSTPDEDRARAGLAKLVYAILDDGIGPLPTDDAFLAGTARALGGPR